MLRRWDTAAGHATAEASDGHGAEVSAIVADADGRIVLSDAADGSVCAWVCEEMTLARQPHSALPAGGGSLLAISLSESGLAATLRSESVGWASLSTWAWAAGGSTLRASANGRPALGEGATLLTAAMAGGSALTVASGAHDIRLWRVTIAVPSELTLTYTGHDDPVTAVAVCSVSALAVSASAGSLHLWRLVDASCQARLTHTVAWPLSACAVRTGALLSGAFSGVIGFYAVLSDSQHQRPLPSPKNHSAEHAPLPPTIDSGIGPVGRTAGGSGSDRGACIGAREGSAVAAAEGGGGDERRSRGGYGASAAARGTAAAGVILTCGEAGAGCQDNSGAANRHQTVGAGSDLGLGSRDAFGLPAVYTERLGR